MRSAGLNEYTIATRHVRLTLASTSSAASCTSRSPNGPNGAWCSPTATAQLIELVRRKPMSTRSSCGSSNGRSTALATSTAQITPHSPQSILPAQPRAAAAQPSASVGAGVGENVSTETESTDAADIARRRRPSCSEFERRRWPSRVANVTIALVKLPVATDLLSTSTTSAYAEP